MRVNLYSEELTDRVELVEKTTPAGHFIGVRFYIYTPVTIKHEGHGEQWKTLHRGPFEKVDNDDDSSAVTFWAHMGYPGDLVGNMRRALELLEQKFSRKPDTAGESA